MHIQHFILSKVILGILNNAQRVVHAPIISVHLRYRLYFVSNGYCDVHNMVHVFNFKRLLDVVALNNYDVAMISVYGFFQLGLVLH